MTFNKLPLLLLIICLACNCIVVHAEENNPNDFGTHIQRLALKEAKVILVPPNLLFRIPFNEESLQEAGCVYMTQDPLLIQSLKDVLQDNQPQIASQPQYFSLYNAVYLTQSNGAVLKLLMNDTYHSTASTHGMINLFSGMPLHFNAMNSLPSQLRRWASINFPSNTQGVQRPKYCADIETLITN